MIESNILLTDHNTKIINKSVIKKHMHVLLRRIIRNITKREEDICSKPNNKLCLVFSIKDIDKDTLDKVVKGLTFLVHSKSFLLFQVNLLF